MKWNEKIERELNAIIQKEWVEEGKEWSEVAQSIDRFMKENYPSTQ